PSSSPVKTSDNFEKFADELALLDSLPLISMDKSKITRIQSKSSKHGHENQKSTKPKPRSPKP
ncbi:hypothetical protein Tco_0113770, partial [Tanacetum coccineum]